jgi:hypothetical protein
MYIIYGLMLVIGLVAMYTLLNAGNPDSLLRPYFPDPRHDVYIAVVSSILVFILGFFVFFSRDREGFRQLVDLNADQIRELRKMVGVMKKLRSPYLLPWEAPAAINTIWHLRS